MGWKCPGGCTAPCADPATRPVPCRWPRLPRSDSSRGGGAKSRPSMPGAPTRGGLGGTPTRLLGDAQRRAGPARRSSCRAPRRGCRLILRSWHGERERKERVRAQPAWGYGHPCTPEPPLRSAPLLVSAEHSALFSAVRRAPGSPVGPAQGPCSLPSPEHGPPFPQCSQFMIPSFLSAQPPPTPCSRCSRSAAPPLSSAPGSQPRLPGARARLSPLPGPASRCSDPFWPPLGFRFPGARFFYLSRFTDRISPGLGPARPRLPRFPLSPRCSAPPSPRFPAFLPSPAPVPRCFPVFPPARFPRHRFPDIPRCPDPPFPVGPRSPAPLSRDLPALPAAVAGVCRCPAEAPARRVIVLAAPGPEGPIRRGEPGTGRAAANKGERAASAAGGRGGPGRGRGDRREQHGPATKSVDFLK